MPRPGELASWAVRLLFAWMSLQAWRAILTVPFEGDPGPWILELWGIAWVFFGMAVPWRAIAASRRFPSERVRAFAEHFVPPGPNLAFLSKAIGWIGSVLVLSPFVEGPWWLALAGLAASVSAFALWARVPWARWAWTVLAVGIVALSGWLLWPVLQDPMAQLERGTTAGYEIGEYLLWTLGLPLLLGAIGFALLRELRRARAAQSR